MSDPATLHSGILNVFKPQGWTSRAVVDRVQRAVKPAKAGHAGTLDPLAEGVLVVCFGKATRLIEWVQRQAKTYEGEFLLGRTSPTEDVEGEVVLLDAPPIPTLEALTAAAAGLTGEIQQRPPAYSALKVNGKRAYDLARAGKEVELAARPVRIDSIEILEYAYPRLRLRVRCGSGTYIRSLGRDLAEAVGTGAVMSALVRTAIGVFHAADALRADHVTPETILAARRPPRDALGDLPTATVPDELLESVRQGKCLDLPDQAAPLLAAIDLRGELVALLDREEGASYHPSKTFF